MEPNFNTKWHLQRDTTISEESEESKPIANFEAELKPVNSIIDWNDDSVPIFRGKLTHNRNVPRVFLHLNLKINVI